MLMIHFPDHTKSRHLVRTCTVGMVTLGLILVGLATGAATPLQPGGPASPFVLAVGQRLAPGPVAWVAHGFGVLAYGAGRAAHFEAESPFPVSSASLVLDEAVSGGVVAGRYAYLAQAGQGLRVIDLAVPAQPVDVGLLTLEGRTFHLARMGDVLLVAADGYGLRVLDLAPSHACHGMAPDPLSIRERGFLPLLDPVSALAAAGDHAYLALEGGGLVVVDLSVPFRPEEVERLPVGPRTRAMAADGDHLYASSSGGEISAWGVSRLESGSPLAVLSFPAAALLAEGRSVYAAGEPGLFLLRAGRAEAATMTVTVNSNFFSPANVTVNDGDTVKWTWASGQHSTTSGRCQNGNCTPDGHWDSGVKTSGSFSHLFTTAGTLPYFCQVHQSAMVGRVTVNGPAVLTATASASPGSGPAPLTVAFSGSAAGGTAPYTYAWEFGDGASSSSQNPSHTYAANGSYPVTLAVTDAASATATDSHLTVTVQDAPPPVITAMKKAGAPFRIVVVGSNLENGIQVFIDGTAWTPVTWKKSTKVIIGGGKSLKAEVPRDIDATFRFVNPDGGQATTTFRWP